MNIKIFYIALLLILCSVIAISSVVQSKERQGEQDRAKLIKFSHQYHIKQIGAECKECHRNAEASQSSADMLLPAMAVCYDCHDHQATKCDYCHTTSDTTRYVAFEKTERETIFSHKYHLTEAKLKCADCHEGLDAVDYAAQGLKTMPAMQKCATCHRLETSLQSEPARDTTKMAMATTTAATACEACHTDLVTLLPKSHRVNNFIQEHKNLARLGTVENNCATCHGENFCQECHDAANLVQNVKLPVNFHTPSAPKTSGNDNTKELIVQKVHGLNYRFTHAIDAKGKESDCLTCHDRAPSVRSVIHQTESKATSSHRSGTEGAVSLRLVAVLAVDVTRSMHAEISRVARPVMTPTATTHLARSVMLILMASRAMIRRHMNPDSIRTYTAVGTLIVVLSATTVTRMRMLVLTAGGELDSAGTATEQNDESQ